MLLLVHLCVSRTAQGVPAPFRPASILCIKERKNQRLALRASPPQPAVAAAAAAAAYRKETQQQQQQQLLQQP